MARKKNSRNKTTLEKMNTVEEWLLKHWSERRVILTGRKQWGCSEKTVKRYIDLVRERWMEEEAKARPSRKAAAVARLTEIARRNVKNPTAQIQAERLIADIQGTKAAEKVQATIFNLDAEADQALALITEALGLTEEEAVDVGGE